MLLFTMGKNGLRRAGALAACAACLAGTVIGIRWFAGDETVTAGAAAEPKVESTQDIATFFSGYGLEIDLSTAAVDKVKIPRKWDDSFSAFHGVLSQSGLSLEKYKGKTVEKWTALCPGLSSGDQKQYCVLLVYKTKPIGAYLLAQPGGEVTGLTASQQTLAEQPAEQPAEETAAAPEQMPAEQPAEKTAAAPEQMPIEETAAEAEGWPVE